VEVERIQREWEVDIEWRPFFLDPTIPPEGRERAPQTSDDTPKSHLELRGEAAGIEFRRGRTFTPNSHLALQAGEWAQEHGTLDQLHAYHRAIFKAFFTDFEDLNDPDVLVRHAEEVGLDHEALRKALETKAYEEQVNEGIQHSYNIGVTGIPTFIINDQYAVVGAQDYEIFEQVFEKFGAVRKAQPAEDAASD
jgi:predicted DsbA family dithiol-disulfide isomerase